MDDASWMLLATAVFLVLAGIVMWRLRARSQAARAASAGPPKPRDKRRGPRRINNSRRESFRMGNDDNDRRKGDDRRQRKPGWNDDPGKRS